MTSAYDEVSIPRLVLAGAGSSTGKTTLTAGIIAAFRRRELRVKPFKVGPDYVDAAYLAHVAGGPCRSLDPWILGKEAILQSFHTGCAEGDLAVIEGMLGLYDSWGAGSDGSTAELSKLIESPVVLVLDVAETVQSAAAIALGFKSVDPAVRIAGVILNRVQHDDHARWVEEAVWRLAKVPVLGWLPTLEELVIPAEDGGLTPVREYPEFAQQVEALAQAVEHHLDLDLLLRVAQRCRPLRLIPRAETPRVPGTESRPVKLGVAYDEAFNLYYPENLEILSEAGAEIIPFSPLDDSHLPSVEGIYLAGAFTDRFASRLSANNRMLESIAAAHDDGVPIYAECGGLMYLAEALLAADGQEYGMVGLLPVDMVAVAGERRMGYREIRPMRDCLVASAGQRLRGHEFHRSRATGAATGLEPAYELFDPSGYRIGHEGYTRNGLLASNIHLHFAQDRELALNLLRSCLHCRPQAAVS